MKVTSHIMYALETNPVPFFCTGINVLAFNSAVFDANKMESSGKFTSNLHVTPETKSNKKIYQTAINESEFQLINFLSWIK